MDALHVGTTSDSGSHGLKYWLCFSTKNREYPVFCIYNLITTISHFFPIKKKTFQQGKSFLFFSFLLLCSHDPPVITLFQRQRIFRYFRHFRNLV